MSMIPFGEWVISIHAPAKGATFIDPKEEFKNVNFNPRSREGSDISFMVFASLLTISIHAPAKGATWVQKIEFIDPKISIHAPAKGATAFINIFSLTVRLFLFHLTNKI